MSLEIVPVSPQINLPFGGLPHQSALPGRPDHMRAKDEGVPNYPDPPLRAPAEHR